MDIQFAFANPKKARRGLCKKRKKKHLAKRKKSSKLKAKRPIKLRPIGKISHKGKKIMKKKHKRRKNPEQVYSTKKTAEGKKLKDVSRIFPTKKEVENLMKKALEYKKKYEAAPEASAAKKMYRLRHVKAEKAFLKAADDRLAELKTLGVKQSEGWNLKLKHIKAGKKAKGEAVAKRKKRKSKKAKKHAAKKVHKKKAMKKVHKKRTHKRRKHSKKHAAKKVAKVTKKHRRRKSHAKKKHSRRKHRHYAKRITHSHSYKVRHVKKGQTLSGVIYSKGKGKKRRSARVKIKFNPLGGLMKVSVKDLTGYEGYAEPLALLAGGAVYQKVNALLQRFVPAQIQAFTLKIPGVGPALLPILAGMALHMAGKKVPGQAGQMVSLLGEGLIGASVVGAGVSLSQSLPFLSTPLSGINYTPMSGVQYTPNMSGINYTPMSGLGRGPDFGAADYGGGAGYTESHKFSAADFGAEDEDADYGDEEAGLGSMA